jgi:GntR family transcriptional regulator
MFDIIGVTLFRLRLEPGQSIFDQVVYGAIRSFVAGEYRPGQPFPSVRSLAAELKIHPNTAHKVVQYLIQQRYLESHPGIGTVVAELPQAQAGEKQRLLRNEVEQLVVEAKRLGLQLDQVVEAVRTQWEKLDSAESKEEGKP